MRPAALTPGEIGAALQAVPAWKHEGNAIRRTVDCETFPAAVALVGAIAVAAEAMNHHPDILIRYNKVTLTLSTHDAGGLTSKDFDLARTIDTLVATKAG